MQEMNKSACSSNENNSLPNLTNDETNDTTLEKDLLNHLAKSKAIFKNQQKDDPDLTEAEKYSIAENLLHKSHSLFLLKFGHFLCNDHLKYFEQHAETNYELQYHLKKLYRYFDNSMRQIDIKNKRYKALTELVEKGEYFSEIEMMKRNPLLYNQLVGQYLTEEERKTRDCEDIKNKTFVNILMDGIEKKNLREKQKAQEEEEDNAIEEGDSDDESENDTHSNNDHVIHNVLNESSESGPTTSDGWGESSRILSEKHLEPNKVHIMHNQRISSSEKHLLREEFLSYMFQSFLDGKDLDFDYSTVDNNEAFENVKLREQDEEEKYFDSEEPETHETQKEEEENESEDELEAFMKTLKDETTSKEYSMEKDVNLFF